MLALCLQGAWCAGHCCLSWMSTTWILSSRCPLHRWDSMEVSGHCGLHRGSMSGAQRVEATWRCLSFFSDTDYLKWLFPTSMRSNLYRICYSPWGQEFSICNYWHGKRGRRVGGPRCCVGAHVDTALWTARAHLFGNQSSGFCLCTLANQIGAIQNVVGKPRRFLRACGLVQN